MKFDRIVGLGDSWMWGDELVDPRLPAQSHATDSQNTSYREAHCFLGQLGRHYNVPTDNLGWPGGSLQLCIYNYIWWQDQPSTCENPLFLVALTDAGRVSWYNPRHVIYHNDPPWNRFVHNTWLRNGSGNYGHEWHQLNKLHDTLSDCQQLRLLNYKQTVMFFQACCAGRVLMFNTGPQPGVMDSPNLLWPNQTLRGLVPHDHFKSLGHPNETGHEIIRDLLIPYIDML